MSKVKELKTIEVEATEVKALTTEQLKSIVDQTRLQNDLLRGIGVLESQKLELYGRLMGVNKEVEDNKKVLEEEYGQVNIDLETGVCTPIEKEDAK
tara:strand:+ start:971 stop:1258 length:288 start_codon:yes stop_codon:yes gene_type:complete